MLSCQRSYYYIGTGTNQGTVATQTSAQSQRPPQWVQIGNTHSAHILNQRNHGSYKWDIVYKGRGNSAHPENQNGGGLYRALGNGHSFSSQHLDNTGFYQSTNQNKQAGKEENSCPLNLAQNLGNFFFIPGKGQ